MSNRGKVVTKLECTAADGQIINVSIKIHTSSYKDPDRVDLTFSAEIPELELKFRDKDINVIKDEILEAVSKHSAMKWRPVLFLDPGHRECDEDEDEDEDSYDSTEMSFYISITCKAYVVGEDSKGNHKHMEVPINSIKTGKWDGTKLMWHAGEIRNGRLDARGLYSDDEDEDHFRRGTVLEPTLENIAILEGLEQAFKALEKQMVKAAHPKRVKQFLATVHDRARIALPLSPEPKKQVKKKKTRKKK